MRLRLPALVLAVLLACTRAEDEPAHTEALRIATEELAAARVAFEADRAAMQQELAELRKAVAGIDAKLAARPGARVPVPSRVSPVLEPPEPPELPMSVEPVPPPTFEEDPLYTMVRCESEVRCKVVRTYWDELLANPAILAKQSRIVPKAGLDGKIEGIKLYGIRRGSLTKALGLKNGDLVRSVNGYVLGSIDQTLELYTKLRGKETFTVEVERKSARLMLTVEIVDHL